MEKEFKTNLIQMQAIWEDISNGYIIQDIIDNGNYMTTMLLNPEDDEDFKMYDMES